MPVYDGSCHCAYIRFRVTTTLDDVDECTCSLCTRRGALIQMVEEKDLELLTPLENCTLYQWNTKTAKDYFCPKCGMLPFRRSRSANHLWSINVRCLEGVDVTKLKVTTSGEGRGFSVVEDEGGAQ